MTLSIEAGSSEALVNEHVERKEKADLAGDDPK
jgi:hypothetical protein